MRRYRDLFGIGEFRALFGGQLALAAAMTIQPLALSVVVFGRTSSSLLAAMAFLSGSLPQALGAVTLSAVSDRLRPRAALVASDCIRAGTLLVLAAGRLSVVELFASLIVCAMAADVLVLKLASPP